MRIYLPLRIISFKILRWYELYNVNAYWENPMLLNILLKFQEKKKHTKTPNYWKYKQQRYYESGNLPSKVGYF